jgi:hypothetical protein
MYQFKAVEGSPNRGDGCSKRSRSGRAYSLHRREEPISGITRSSSRLLGAVGVHRVFSRSGLRDNAYWGPWDEQPQSQMAVDVAVQCRV